MASGETAPPRLTLRACQRLLMQSCMPLHRMNGGMQEIEFVIHPDGRVEEKVTGVKGKNCQEITKEIEEKLGKVTYTQPTSEMFEEEITLTTKDVQKNTLSPGGNSPNSGNKWTQF